MSLDLRVLSELLDALRTGEGLDLINRGAAPVCEELLEFARGRWSWARNALKP